MTARRTIQREWTGYFERVLAAHVTEVRQYSITRGSFFAGASAALALVADHKSGESYAERIETLIAELEEFCRERKKGRL